MVPSACLDSLRPQVCEKQVHDENQLDQEKESQSSETCKENIFAAALFFVGAFAMRAFYDTALTVWALLHCSSDAKSLRRETTLINVVAVTGVLLAITLLAVAYLASLGYIKCAATFGISTILAGVMVVRQRCSIEGDSVESIDINFAGTPPKEVEEGVLPW